ncbi:MAG: hypothetical protein ACLPQS_11305 [Acidimicrobiales bacterium]
MSQKPAGGIARLEALTPLDEPERLLASLRRRAGTQPDRIRDIAPRELAAHAWKQQQWREALEAAGLGQEHIRHAFATAKWEIWLWVRGNRVWEQLSAHLIGRLVRRAGAA